jgi:hypothetical protein
MKKERTLIFVLALALAFTLGIQFSHAQMEPPTRAELDAPARPAGVDSYFPVQGRLTNASGAPLNGNYTLTFRVYGVSTGGTALCSHIFAGTPVTNGLFSVNVLCANAFDGRAAWLGITVGSDAEMTPRQPIYPVPYAMSLRPGAIVSDTLAGNPILHIENWDATGRGLRAYAMATSGTNYGTVGASRSPSGYGGYFYNSGGGVGLKAESIDAGIDLVLGGNANTTTGDDGVIASDPAYPSSDIVLLSNDGVRINLDHDGDGEDADFEIRNKDDTLIFNVDESGDVSYSGALVGAFPRPGYDSGWVVIGQNATSVRTHGLGGNVDNYVVNLTCKSVAEGINNWGDGGDWNWTEFYGAYWYNLTTSAITVKRMNHDISCPQFRIRIWVYK